MGQYREIAENRVSAVVRADGAEAIEAALVRGEACSLLSKAGRGDVYEFPVNGSQGVVRRYQRGGLLRFLSPSAFLMVNRPLREWRVLTYLYQHESCVPEPFGVMWRRTLCWYSGAIATNRIAAVTLQEYLGNGASGREAVLREIGKQIRSIHDLGVYHADLQIRNILIGTSDENRGRVYLIDFDKARRHGALSQIERVRNLLRLRRSLVKNGFDDNAIELICRGYGMYTFPWWLDWMYRLKGAISDVGTGRRKTHAA